MQKPSDSHGNTKTLHVEKPVYAEDKPEETAKAAPFDLLAPSFAGA